MNSLDANALEAAAATWARFLMVSLILIALILVAGVACGGNDDGEDSRSSSLDERESSGDNEERDEGEECRRSGGTTGGLSVQDLEYVPNLRYDRVVLVDVNALLHGDVPVVLATVPGIHEVWLDIQDVLGSTEENPVAMDMEEVETFIALEWENENESAFLIKGDSIADTVGDFLSSSDDGEQLTDGDTGLEVWEVGYDTLAFDDNLVYGVDDSFEDSSTFLEQLEKGDWLLKESDSPIVRAVERLGVGWLVFAKTDICDYECLVEAFAVHGASESAVEATWVVLFESRGEATAQKLASEEGITTSSSYISYSADSDFHPDTRWITKVDTDGEFLVFEVSVPIQEAAEFFGRLIGQLEYP